MPILLMSLLSDDVDVSNEMFTTRAGAVRVHAFTLHPLNTIQEVDKNHDVNVTTCVSTAFHALNFFRTKKWKI